MRPWFSCVAIISSLATVFVAGSPELSRVGQGNVIASEPIMPSEDFGAFGSAAGIPSALLWVGATEPGSLARATAAGTTVAGLHTAGFTPDRERTIRTGVAALTRER